MSTPNLDCRLLCAAASSYLIQPGSKSGQYDPSEGADANAKVQYDAVGYSEDPWIVSDGIDATLVGKTSTEVIIAFRGTLPPNWKLDDVLDWLNDIILVEPESNINLPGKVHGGFLRSLITLAEQTMDAVNKVNTGGLPVYITGHSKGGGIAPIAAAYFKHVYNLATTNVVTFAGPKPGDEDFAKAYDAMFPDDIRYENYLDMVPLLPPSKDFAELAAKLLKDVSKDLAKLFIDAAAWDYATVGTLKYIEKDGKVIDDYFGLIDIRVAEVMEKLVTLDISAIGDAHHSACCYGYMKGTCQSSVDCQCS